MIPRLLARPSVAIAGLALAASASGLGNGFVYDDIPIILQNPLIRHAESVGMIWGSAYWPAGLLYRPVTTQLFAVEWAVGGGRQVVFHAVSVLLMMLVAVLFWRLARRILPALPALIAAALFAAHPVHAESVANLVGQAELLATALTLLVVERYLAWRDQLAGSAGRRAGLAVLTLAAILSKETGFVIPLLLIAAEVFLVGRTIPWRDRLRAVGPALLLQFGVVATAILLRIIVLGPTPGAGPAAALRDLPPAQRIVGMLAVVPEWARLLFWPAHLQAEYGPPAVAVTGPFGGAHLVGIVLLFGALALLVGAWRRFPVVAFGLGWIGIALLPVSNVLTTTGVVLAERTLFLPSAGAMLLLGGMLAILGPRLAGASRPVKSAAAIGIGTLLLAAVVRSAERQLVWREQAAFIRRMESDAPTTYRAHLVASNYYSEAGNHFAAERAGRRAYLLFRGDPQVYEQFGQTLRRQGRCAEALPVLAEGVERFPDRTVARSRLIECALATGDTARARRVVEEALALGQEEFSATARRLRPPGREPAPRSP